MVCNSKLRENGNRYKGVFTHFQSWFALLITAICWLLLFAELLNLPQHEYFAPISFSNCLIILHTQANRPDMPRLLLITLVILVVSVMVARSCFFKSRSFNPGNTAAGFRPGQSAGDTSPGTGLQAMQDTSPGWTDGLLMNYLARTGNELIRQAREDSIPLEWMMDRLEDTDTAAYFVFHVGHTVADDGMNRRFVTDAWVYIDSLTRKIYEYDVANDSLVEWKK